MRILVINGDCVQVNSSANLCHLAYLNGLSDAGHDIVLLSAAGNDYKVDPAMKIPPKVRCFTYYGVSLYEKCSLIITKKSPPAVVDADGQTGKSRSSAIKKAVKKCKKVVLALYGPHGIYASFLHRAKRFHDSEAYDCVISLSTPPSSHRLAHYLLSSRHIIAKHWIQVWEDPWYSDAYGFNGRKEVFSEEKRLLSYAEKICYVSPITLENQKKLFPEMADKMFWQPLPAYYSASGGDRLPDKTVFGYFGDYSLPARDLGPFAEAARECAVPVIICGGSNRPVEADGNIRVYPRMPLEQLRPYEEQAGVLVFLCNKAGGQIPGKIYQYSATARTILFILDGTEEEKNAIRSFFAPYNRYVFCENDPEDIARAIRGIVRGELGEIKNVPLTDFEPKKIIQRILEEGMKQ